MNVAKLQSFVFALFPKKLMKRGARATRIALEPLEPRFALSGLTTTIVGDGSGVPGGTESVVANVQLPPLPTNDPTGFGLAGINAPFTPLPARPNDVRAVTSDQNGVVHIVGGSGSGQPARQLIQFGATVIPGSVDLLQSQEVQSGSSGAGVHGLEYSAELVNGSVVYTGYSDSATALHTATTQPSQAGIRNSTTLVEQAIPLRESNGNSFAYDGSANGIATGEDEGDAFVYGGATSVALPKVGSFATGAQISRDGSIVGGFDGGAAVYWTVVDTFALSYVEHTDLQPADSGDIPAISRDVFSDSRVGKFGLFEFTNLNTFVVETGVWNLTNGHFVTSLGPASQYAGGMIVNDRLVVAYNDDLGGHLVSYKPDATLGLAIDYQADLASLIPAGQGFDAVYFHQGAIFREGNTIGILGYGVKAGLPNTTFILGRALVQTSGAPAAAATPTINWSVDWGDGTVQTMSGTDTTVTLTHVWKNVGNYTVKVSASDGTNTSNLATQQFVISSSQMITDSSGKKSIVIGGNDSGANNGADSISVQLLSTGVTRVTVNGVATNYTGVNGSITVNGQGGNDSITFSNVTVPIWAYGGAGNDTINGSTSREVHFSGGDGNDYLVGGTVLSVLLGDAGNDILRGLNGVNIIFGGAGSDAIQASTARSVASGDVVNALLTDAFFTNLGNELAGQNRKAVITSLVSGKVTDEAASAVDLIVASGWIVDAGRRDLDFSLASKIIRV